MMSGKAVTSPPSVCTRGWGGAVERVMAGSAWATDATSMAAFDWAESSTNKVGRAIVGRCTVDNDRVCSSGDNEGCVKWASWQRGCA